MIITISGIPGSGKSVIADILAEKLKMDRFSVGDLMRDIGHKRGYKDFLEFSKIALTDPSIDKELDKTQKKLGKEKDNFIIDGRLSWYFIPNSIKIFLDVDLDVAAKRIFNANRKDEKDTSLEKTKENIKKRMQIEIERYKKAYGINYLEKKNYDYYLDTTNLTIEQVVELILTFLRKKDKI